MRSQPSDGDSGSNCALLGNEANRAGKIVDGLVLLVFCLGTLQLTSAVWFEEHPTRRLRAAAWADQMFIAWAVARNAYTLSHKPLEIFDAEPCHPVQKSLALGHPLITHGLVGVVPYLLTGDPVTTYHFVITAIHLIAALAMYLLVKDWTASRAAGAIAGILYAFGPMKAGPFLHAFHYDTSWAVFGLFFVRRFFAWGRWRDGLAAAVFCSLQLALAGYPAFATAFLALPLSLWMLKHYRIGRTHIGPGLASLALLAVAVFLILGPYLEVQSAEDFVHKRDFHFRYTAWGKLFPLSFPALFACGLAVIALVAPRKRALAGIDGDPRWALVCGGLLVSLLATGGTFLADFTAATNGGSSSISIPNLYPLAARVVPGLSSVRIPSALSSGLHLVIALLAGLGSAAILSRCAGRGRPWIATALILTAYIVTLRPAVLGLEPPTGFSRISSEPRAETIEFYETLANLGNAGPLLEVPSGPMYVAESSRRAWLSAYHHRRTSSCYNSFRPPRSHEVSALSSELPDRNAIASLRAMGFTTLVVHHPSPSQGRRKLLAELAEAEKEPNPMLQLLHETTTMTAYSLQP